MEWIGYQTLASYEVNLNSVVFILNDEIKVFYDKYFVIHCDKGNWAVSKNCWNIRVHGRRAVSG